MPSMNKVVRINSHLHNRIVEAVKTRRDLSVKVMRKKYPDWEDAELLHSAYVPDTARSLKVQSGRTAGTDDFTTIKVSMSYATAMSMHTYYTSVFMGRNPVFQVTGRHGEPEMGVQGVEALMDYQLMVGKMLPPFYVWFLDTVKFGVGFIGNYWDEEYTVASRIEEVPVTFLGLPVPGKFRKARFTDKLVNYQGNKIFNVRPYDMRVDPRVDLQNYQKGEFMGRKVRFVWNDLIQGEADGKYFNIEEIQQRRLKKWMEHRENQVGDQMYPENDHIGANMDMAMNDTGTLEGEEMVVMLQPSKWGLGSSSYPEKWVFTIVEDEVLIGCRPLGAYHGRFPYSILEYEMDGGLLFKRGVHEILKPMDATLNWLVNTHFFNIRRVLNDNLIVDPSRVVLADLQDNKPGKLIRLRRSAWGEDPRSAVHQLAVQDVTQQHLMDTRLINELSHKMVGVNDNIMGMIHPGGRKTATEIRTSSTFGINRQKTNSEWYSATGWTDNFDMCLANTQQYYDGERIFKIAGELGSQMMQRPITPMDIAGQYDFVPVDGTMPIDRFAQANLWKELFTALTSMAGEDGAPPMGFDLSKIFAYTAQLAGAKNINQFKIQVTDDEALMREAERGNIRPINSAGGTSGNPEAPGRLPAAPAVGRVGTTG